MTGQHGKRSRRRLRKEKFTVIKCNNEYVAKTMEAQWLGRSGGRGGARQENVISRQQRMLAANATQNIVSTLWRHGR